MKPPYSFLLTMLAAMAAGAGGLRASQAQAPFGATAPAFYVAEFELTDPEGIRPYSARVASTFEPFDGRFRAASPTRSKRGMRRAGCHFAFALRRSA